MEFGGSWRILTVFLITFLALEVDGSCVSLDYTPSNSSRDILCHLNTIVGFTEEKIRQMEAKKEHLVQQMLQGERQSVAFAKEKVAKESRAADLTKNIADLNVRVTKATAQRDSLQKSVNTANQNVATKTNQIRATQSRIASLQVAAANAKRAVDAANARIAAEKAKRNCYFKIGKKRKRKRRRAFRMRRIRIRGRRIIREVRRVIRKLTPCVIDNIFSRLNRDKEHAERSRNNYNNQLLAAQREKVVQDVSLRKLVVQKNVLLNQLTSLKSSLSKLVAQLNADTSSLAQNKRELTDVINRIANLKSMLANLEVQLKAIRLKKSEVLTLITTLKIETQKKVSDIKDLEDADPDEIEDILEDIAEINAEIKKSVAKLRTLLCG